MKAGRNITIAVSVLLLVCAYFASTFWLVFIIPLPVLLFCQWVALSAEEKSAERFFGFTDLAYYLIVGAVIGLGAQFLSEFDRILQQDAEITFSQAEAQLPAAREAAQAASQLRQEASASLEKIPPEVLGDCVARQLAADMMEFIEVDPQRERDGLLLTDYPPGCELPLSVVDASTLALGDAISANNRARELSEVVERGPHASVTSSDLVSPDDLEWVLLRLFPTLLLCGLMFKVGKATLSIRKSA